MVGAEVSAPPKPPNSPAVAAVVAGTAVLEAPAAGMQLDTQRLKQIAILRDCRLPLSANDITGTETNLSWWGLQLWWVPW